MSFKKINNITGWAVCILACAVYIMTMEATGSFWDCGEFASSAYKLQVPHPPGAPLFVLIGRLFMAPFDPQHAATGINLMSALASGFTILFLFWSITHFARKIVTKNNEALSQPQLIGVMAAGVVGALAYTFSDSFWYSAVEGEVYALSSFFTAIVFWAILKWEQNVTEEIQAGIKGHFTPADKWIILIFFLMGLSIGVHLLNLLAIPAIVMVYYFKRYNVTKLGTFVAFFIGCVLTGIVQKAVIVWSISGAGAFDRLFVNDLGAVFFTGFGFYFILLAVLLFFGIRLSIKKNWNFLKLGLLSLSFMLIGYSTYLTTLIRSNANPSVDMYNVDNPASLVGYLSREQYGDWPILFGNDFTETPPQKEGSTLWLKGKDKYEDGGKMGGYDYGAASNAHLFPRMWDFNNERQQHTLYKSVAGLEEGEQPTLGQNIKYFFKYQLGTMYLRYFMWNFAGKQNDNQGFGNSRDGNFISGIGFIDNALLGANQSKMPDSISTNNKAHNKLYFLPLILGILGIIFQFKKDKRNAIVTTLLFLFTGFAIVLYLNQAGFQPRERDYAYVGSFYAFSIFIGLGVLYVQDLIQRFAKNAMLSSTIAATLCTLAVPVLMATQEWDDHDRSKKTLAKDLGKDYLESCAPNAILVSYGDNDTYPLWYAQEVEGIRKDVRVINSSLLGTDWYINQLRYKLNESAPMDVIFTEEQIAGNNRNAVIIRQTNGYDANKYYDLYDIFKNYTSSDDQSKQAQVQSGDFYSVIPSTKVSIPVDVATVRADTSLKITDSLFSELRIDLKGQAVYKNNLAILSLIAANKWKRPIYFTSTQELEEIGIDKFVEAQGIANRLVPYATPGIAKDWSYNKMVNQFTFGNANTAGVYFDEENRRHLMGLRQSYAQLAIFLSETGNKDSAKNVLNTIDKGISDKNFPYGMTSNRQNSYNAISLGLLDASYRCGNNELAKKISGQLEKDLKQQLAFYQSLGDSEMSDNDLMRNVSQAMKGEGTNFSDKQMAYVQDIGSSLQILANLNRLKSQYEKGATGTIEGGQTITTQPTATPPAKAIDTQKRK
jgi:Protein of unknown function (DUF2723)